MNSYDDLINNAPSEGQQQAGYTKEEFAARKKASREAMFALSDSTALDIAGDGGKLQKYLDVQSRFDRYSAINSLLILAQKPEAQRLGSYEHWKAQGAFVKNGEVGISIMEPQEYTKEDGSPGVGYNVKKVFDISQVDTRKMKTEPPPPTYSDRQILAALVSKPPVKITSVDYLGGNLGAVTDPESGEIRVRRGMPFTDIFRSVAQELAAAQLRDAPGAETDTNFSAYCAAYVLCKKYGVDTKEFDFSNAPATLEGMDAREVKAEFSKVHDAVSEITGRIIRHLDSVQKAAREQGAR